jgi:multidrug efflux pump subunit AcrA (membrane-fusion protein)
LRRLCGGWAFVRGRRLVAGGLIGLAVAALLAVLVWVPADFTVEARSGPSCRGGPTRHVWVPADFTVEARGELQPVERRDVFAPLDGVVREVRAKHGARVSANQVLVVLSTPDLDLEFKRVGGELQTARKQLAAVETEQLQNRREDDVQRRRVTELTAEQEELRERVASLEAQHAILLRQQAELEVRSPLAGEVLTWNVEHLLTARPVVRGQILLTVANLEGAWALELRIPDRRTSPVLQAQRTSAEPVNVSYTLATNPRRVLQGQLARLGQRTEITETQDAVVFGTVRIDPREVPERVPGAGVVAKVYCGQRAVGYVWLHDLLDTLWSWLFF